MTDEETGRLPRLDQATSERFSTTTGTCRSSPGGDGLGSDAGACIDAS